MLQELKAALLCRRDSAPPGATRKLCRRSTGSTPENQLQPAGPLGLAHIQKHLALPKKEQRGTNSTVVFLFRADSLPSVDGTPRLPCALLASFGMDGYSTLIWNTIVRLKYPHLITQPGFVMDKLIFKQPIPDSPLTPSSPPTPPSSKSTFSQHPSEYRLLNTVNWPVNADH